MLRYVNVKDSFMKCMLKLVFISITICAATTTESKTKHPKHKCLLFCISAASLICAYAVYYVIRKEKKKKERFELFMERSRQEIPQLCTVPPSVVRAHETLRTDLFNNFFKGSQLYETLEEADATTKSECFYGESWQRKLAPEVKQELKKLLLRRAISTLQCYEISRKEYTAKTLLYQKGLLHGENFSIIEEHYQNLVNDLEFLIFEANCLDHDWGTGLLQTASAILQHEKVTAQDQKRRAELVKKTQSKTLQRPSQIVSIVH